LKKLDVLHPKIDFFKLKNSLKETFSKYVLAIIKKKKKTH